jgi:hypothetical protein
MSELDSVLLARIDERVGALTSKVNALETRFEDTHEKLEEVSAQINRWKGAGPLLLTIGAIVGGVVASADWIIRKFA